MSVHAILSPSGAHRWLRCPGSVALSNGIKDSSSSYAEEGTAAHELAAIVLGLPNAVAAGYVGRLMENGVPVTEGMAEYVQEYVDYVRAMAGDKSFTFLEVALPLEGITGEKDALGTADVVMLRGKELVVIDLKFGMGEEVQAEGNEQLLMYASAALKHFDILSEFNSVRCVVHQPRISKIPSEWVISIGDVRAFEARVAGVVENLNEGKLNPGVKQCRWCKAKAKCPAIAKQVQETVGAMFEDISKDKTCPAVAADDALSTKMSAVDLIEQWCKAVRAAVETTLVAGKPVDGYKLVRGRLGNRKWSDVAEAEKVLKSLRIGAENIYDYKLVSPTTMEKLRKAGTVSDKQWPKVEALIVQEPGGLSVAPVSDKRPAVAIQQTLDMFE